MRSTMATRCNVLDNDTTLALALLIQRVSSLQELDVVAQRVEVDTDLRSIYDRGSDLWKNVSLCTAYADLFTYRKCTHRRNVTTLSTLCLNDEHPVATGRRALLDRVAGID